MKIFLTTLVMILFLNSNSVGDIRDFELEGISIGDSFLDYYNKPQIRRLFIILGS